MESEIWQAFIWTEQNRLSYLKAIENRNTGSHWGRMIPWKELVFFPWIQLHKEKYIPGVHLPDCLYYFLDEHKTAKYLPAAKQNFRLLSSFNNQDLEAVQITEGAHGIQLISPLVTEQKPKIAWLILGQASYENKQKVNEVMMVWSAYPGEITSSIKHIKEFDGTIESLLKSRLPIAVKGI
jgi:hypothetical protein